MSADDTSHDDLMDLGSRTAYRDDLAPGPDSYVEINGKKYVVEDVHTDADTGLDALTLRNDATGERTIAFQGTHDIADALADATLITSITPAQYRAANTYVSYVNQTYGTVNFTCGNSLGGGLAASTAATNPGIQAVTVNPAPVPESLVGKRDFSNVHNYITEYDVLNRVVRAGGLEGRVLGGTTRIHGTTGGFQFLLANHIGSDRDSSVYDASMATPFSLFDGSRVIGEGGDGAKVDITVENLELIAVGLDRQRSDLTAMMQQHLAAPVSDLITHRDNLDYLFSDLHDEVLRAIVEPWNRLRVMIEPMRQMLRRASQLIIESLPSSMPGPLRFLADKLFRVAEEIIDAAAAALQAVLDVPVEQLVDIAWRAGQEPFIAESRVLTEKLMAQGTAMIEDWALVDAKWAMLSDYLSQTTTDLAAADDQLAVAIASRGGAPSAITPAVGTWPEGAVRPLKDTVLQQFAQNMADARAIAAGSQVEVVAGAITVALELPINALYLKALEFEVDKAAIRAASTAVQSMLDPGLLGDWALSLVGLDDDLARFRRWLADSESAYVDLIDQQEREFLRLKDALDGLPLLIVEMTPYFTETFFPDSLIQSVYDSFAKCRNVVERSSVSFAEVDYQLADHVARAIEKIGLRSAEMQRDLSTMGNSFTEMIA